MNGTFKRVASALLAFVLTVSTAVAGIPGGVFAAEERSTDSGFVSTQGTNFVLDGKTFRYVGTNCYYLIYKTKTDVDNIMTDAQDMGLTVIRSWGHLDAGTRVSEASSGSYAKFEGSVDGAGEKDGVYFQYWDSDLKRPVVNEGEDGLQRLDYVLASASEHDVRMLLTLSNYWQPFGGMEQYVKWAKEAGENVSAVTDFYSNETIKGWFKDYIKTVLNHTNVYTGVKYKDDPTVFAWELANEPRYNAQGKTTDNNAMYQWAKEMSEFIKNECKAKQMVSVGDEGGLYYNAYVKENPGSQAVPEGDDGKGINANKECFHGGMGNYHQLMEIDTIDFGTPHLYPKPWTIEEEDSIDAWLRIHAEVAHANNKPVILEEFGWSQHEDGQATGIRSDRDTYFKYIYSKLDEYDYQGSNFWMLGSHTTGDDCGYYPDYDGFTVYNFKGTASTYDGVDRYGTNEIIKEYAQKLADESGNTGETSIKSATVAKKTLTFDKNADTTEDVVIPITINDAKSLTAVSEVQNGTKTKLSTSDYQYADNTLTIKASYLKKQSGNKKYCLQFEQGNDVTITINITDSAELKVIDNFESYSEDGALSSTWVRNGNGGSVTTSLVTGKTDSKAMSYTYDSSSAGYAGVRKNVSNLPTASYDGISFWIQAEKNANKDLTIQIIEPAGSKNIEWEKTIKWSDLNAENGTTVKIPFSEFTAKSADYVASPSQGQKCGDNEPSAFALYVGGSDHTGTFYVDDIQLYRDGSDTTQERTTETTTEKQTTEKTTEATTEETVTGWKAVEGENYGHGSSAVSNAKAQVKASGEDAEVSVDYSANATGKSTAKVRNDFAKSKSLSGKKYVGFDLTYPKELDGKISATLKGTKKKTTDSSQSTTEKTTEATTEKKTTEKTTEATTEATTEKTTEQPSTEQPTGEKKDGLYVKGTKLYDADGYEFVMKGVNLPHAWYTDKTKQSIEDVAALGSNTVRVVLAEGSKYSKTSRSEVENIINWCKANDQICVLEIHDFTGSDEASNITQNAVNYWTELKDLLNANKKYVIVNIANEWQGTWDKDTLWGDTYATAVKALRDAGIENVLMIDSSGYGQESKYMIRDCKKVLAADTTGNTMFSYHMYSVLGKDADTIKTAMDGILNQNVCLCIGEFAYWQNGGEVDEVSLVDYCTEKNVGWLAWSWAGNGGIDQPLDMTSAQTFSKNDLTDWGKWVFEYKNGIKATAKLAYKHTGTGTSGGSTSGGLDTPDIKDPDIVVDDGEVPVEAGELKNYTWMLGINGSDQDPCQITTMEELENGGIRVNCNLAKENYPSLIHYNSKGYDLSKHKTISLVVRNTNASAVQVNLILKAGEYTQEDGSKAPKWYEPNKANGTPYINVPGGMTQLITFDITGDSIGADLADVKGIIFRIQPSSGVITHPVDIVSMGYDLDDTTYENEIAEMNRPKSASYFTWSYPETSFQKTKDATCDENGKLTITYDAISSGENQAAGIQTETRPGLGVGMDFTKYKTITATLTNKGTTDVHTTLIVKNSADWTWAENGGAIAGTSEEGERVIKPGESVDVVYYLKHATWKTKASNWQYTGKLEDLDDVRAIAFKVYGGSATAVAGSLEISNFEVHFNEPDVAENVVPLSKARTLRMASNGVAAAGVQNAAEETIFESNATFYEAAKTYDAATGMYKVFVYTTVDSTDSMDALTVGLVGDKTAYKGTLKIQNLRVTNELPKVEGTDPEKPGTEEPSTEKPGTEEPSTEKPGTEEPSTEEPGTEEPDVIAVTGVTLNKKSAELELNDSLKLVPTIAPSNATDQTVTWISSDEDVVLVDKHGVVTPMGAGKATVTVKTKDGGFTAKCTITVRIAVTGVRLNPAELNLTEKAVKTLAVTVLPSNAENQNVSFTSSDESIATVDQNGKVTAKKAGTATITVVTEDGKYAANCKVTVTKATTPVTGISCDLDDLELTVGEKQQISAKVMPADASNQELEWSSSNPAVATVDENGTVKAVANGTAKITVTTSEGDYAHTITVTVKKASVSVQAITLSEKQLSLEPADVKTLTATITPANASVKNVEWSSTNEKVAVVDKNGQITALTAGWTIIKATAQDGSNVVAVCSVKVTVPVESVSIKQPVTSMKPGESQTLTVNVEPQEATDQDVTFTSSDEKIASVDANGKILALRAGKTTITVSAENDPEKKDSFELTVTKATIDGLHAAWSDVTFKKSSDWDEVKENKETVEYNHTALSVKGVPKEGCKVKATVAIPGTVYVKPEYAGAIKLGVAMRLGDEWKWVETTSTPEIRATDLKWNKKDGCYEAEVEVTFADSVKAYFDVDSETASLYKENQYAGEYSFAEVVKEKLKAVTLKCAGYRCDYSGDIYIKDLSFTDGDKEVQKDTESTTQEEKEPTTEKNTPAKTEKKENVIANVPEVIEKTYGNKAFNLNAKAVGALHYKSSNEAVVSVDAKGKVTLKGYGIAIITITADGDEQYAKAEQKVTIKVAPKKVTLKSVKSPVRKTLKVQWKKDKKATGYEIQYSTSKKFKKASKVLVKKGKTTKKTITKKIKGGKTYYVRVRAYKLSGGQKVYGAWSKAKKVGVKR